MKSKKTTAVPDGDHYVLNGVKMWISNGSIADYLVVASKAIQVHGAYGLSSEYPLERYFRDARVYTIPDGTTQVQHLIIEREALGMSAIR